MCGPANTVHARHKGLGGLQGSLGYLWCYAALCNEGGTDGVLLWEPPVPQEEEGERGEGEGDTGHLTSVQRWQVE